MPQSNLPPLPTNAIYAGYLYKDTTHEAPCWFFGPASEEWLSMNDPTNELPTTSDLSRYYHYAFLPQDYEALPEIVKKAFNLPKKEKENETI